MQGHVKVKFIWLTISLGYRKRMTLKIKVVHMLSGVMKRIIILIKNNPQINK